LSENNKENDEKTKDKKNMPIGQRKRSEIWLQ
jgi:hypothetical protein